MKTIKIIRVALMTMGAIWLLFIAWSYVKLPVVRQSGSTAYTSQLSAEERYVELKSYCSTLGMASEKEGITPEKKTALFVGEHADLSNISITARLRFEDGQRQSSIGYSLKCTHSRWSGNGSDDYKNLAQKLTGIINGGKGSNL